MDEPPTGVVDSRVDDSGAAGSGASRHRRLWWTPPLVVAGLFIILIGKWTHGLAAFSVYSAARVEAGPLPRKAPPLRFVDTSGRLSDATTSDGAYRLVNFFYASCPEACPVVMLKMDRVKAALGDLIPGKVRFVSLSFDHDPPDVLRAVWAMHGSPVGWTMGTLTALDQEPLLERLGVVVIRRKDGLINHTLDLFLIDPDGVVRAVFSPDDPPDQIADAIRGFL